MNRHGVVMLLSMMAHAVSLFFRESLIAGARGEMDIIVKAFGIKGA